MLHSQAASRPFAATRCATAAAFDLVDDTSFTVYANFPARFVPASFIFSFSAGCGRGWPLAARHRSLSRAAVSPGKRALSGAFQPQLHLPRRRISCSPRGALASMAAAPPLDPPLAHPFFTPPSRWPSSLPPQLMSILTITAAGASCKLAQVHNHHIRQGLRHTRSRCRPSTCSSWSSRTPS